MVLFLSRVVDEKVNAHLPYYSTLKNSGKFSSKRFKLECSSSVVSCSVLAIEDSVSHLSCSDVDECADRKLNDCDTAPKGKCHNVHGSFVCRCLDGYRMCQEKNRCEGKCCIVLQMPVLR